MPHSSKWTKTPSSKANTTSSDAQFPRRFDQQHQEMTLPPQRQWKGKKKRYPEHQHQIKSLTWSTKLPTSILWTKKRKRCRDEKLCLNWENEERKAKLLDMEIQERDMQFFLNLHDHLTGDVLWRVLERKQQIAKKYG